jgi:exodeoxyribonuclease X
MIGVWDVETTGLDHEKDSVVEVACVPLVQGVSDSGWCVRPGASSLVTPGRRVPPEARAVHHIGDEELRTAPQLPMAMADIMMAVDVRGERFECLAAHNASFDRGFIGQYFPSDLPWLDTLRCAMHTWPDVPSYSNGTLFYWLGIDKTMPVTEARTHRALYDATVTAHLLRWMLQTHSLADLLDLQSRPVLQRTCRFGKHRGTAWSDVPRDYLGWVLRQDNPPFEDDVVHTCRHWLGY